MKTFICDLGWRGGLVVVAESKEEAFKIIQSKDTYSEIDIDELYEVLPNTKYRFYGDE